MYVCKCVTNNGAGSADIACCSDYTTHVPRLRQSESRTSTLLVQHSYRYRHDRVYGWSGNRTSCTQNATANSLGRKTNKIVFNREGIAVALHVGGNIGFSFFESIEHTSHSLTKQNTNTFEIFSLDERF